MKHSVDTAWRKTLGLLMLSCCKMNCEWDNVKNRPQTANVGFLKTEPQKPSFRFFNLWGWFGSAFRKPISDIFNGFCTPLEFNISNFTAQRWSTDALDCSTVQPMTALHGDAHTMSLFSSSMTTIISVEIASRQSNLTSRLKSSNVTGHTTDDVQPISGTLRSLERSFFLPLPSENFPASSTSSSSSSASSLLTSLPPINANQYGPS